MKKNLILAMLAVAGLALTSCEKNNEPELKADPVGTTYDRVQLIEHFTGDECGYCPAGMDYIYEVYSKNPDTYVWVSNHAGYNTDEYTITESKTIQKKLGVSGAPSISINRTKQGSARNYHPYYTEQYMKKQESTADVQLSISHTYAAATNQLHVTVTGKANGATSDILLLTVGVTESGLVGKQADYNDSWEGWSKFTHTHVIRTYLTEALGNEVLLQDRVFKAEFDCTVDAKWVADNCEIVAWVTPTEYWPVLNATKKVLVDGTKGGEDIKHGGVEAAAVSDTYPEPTNVTPKTEVVMTDAQYKVDAYDNYAVVTIAAQNSSLNCGNYGSYGTMFPYVNLYVFLPTGATELPTGSYDVTSAETANINNVCGGYRDDEKFEIGGSCFYYLFNYNSKQYVGYQWLVNSGTLTVTADGWSFAGTSRNGSTLSFSFSGAMTKATAPARVPAKLGMTEAWLPSKD